MEDLEFLEPHATCGGDNADGGTLYSENLYQRMGYN